MKITVITATWNSELTIADTLQSLASQEYQNVEYIVIDGASSDRTLEIIRSHGGDVDRLLSEKDAGIYDALNKGISMASGDVVGFLHSDDVYSTSDALSKIARAFDDPEVDAVYGDLEYVAKLNVDKVVRRWVSGCFDLTKMKLGWMPPHPTFYMRRSCYEKFGGFNLCYKIAADYDALVRYLWVNNISIRYIPEVLVKMRVGGESNRSISNIIRKSKEDAEIMSRNGLPVIRAMLGKNLSKIPQFLTGL